MRPRNRPVRYLIPYVHLDTQWRWTCRTTISRYLVETVRKNISLLKDFPHYRLNFTGAYRYSLLEQYHHELFEELLVLIREHRWIPAGSLWEETDVIIPSEESLIRNIIYGQGYYRSRFSTFTSDVMLPDSFGFLSDLPTVLAHCRISGFTTQKLSWDPVSPAPFPLGIWNGPDGKGIPALLQPGPYTTRMHIPPHLRPLWAIRLRSFRRQYDVNKDAHLYGTGDTGQSPGRWSVRMAEISHRRMLQGPSDLIFSELSDQERSDLPRYAGELLLTRHSAGSLSSNHIMKRWNKRLEQLAFLAESAAVCASAGMEYTYPKGLLEKAWKMIIENQMHDILPGTSIPEVYHMSTEKAVAAANILNGIIDDSLYAVSLHLPLQKRQEAILLYNPTGWQREEIITCRLPAEAGKIPHFTDPEGHSAAAQLLDTDGLHCTCAVKVNIPPCGWVCYRMSYESGSSELEMPEEGGPCSIENEYLKVSVNAEGNICSILDKRIDSELLRGPMQHILQRETPHAFPAWNMDWKDRRNPPEVRIAHPKSISCTSEGSLIDTISITHEFGDSVLERSVSLHHGEREDMVFFNDHITWRERACSLKLSIPFAYPSEQDLYRCDIAHVRRPVNSPRHYEFPSKGWIDHEKTDGSYGAAFIHSDIYGSDRPDEFTLRPTLLFTPGRSWRTFRFLDQMTQDRGEHSFCYALYLHDRAWQHAELDRHMASLHAPIRPYHITRTHRAIRNYQKLPLSSSLCRLSSEHAAITSIKQAENDGKRTIIRIKELLGEQDHQIHIRFSHNVIDAYEVDGCENPLLPVSITDQKIHLSLQAYEIRSFSVLLQEEQRSQITNTHQDQYMKTFSVSDPSPSLFSYQEERETQEQNRSIPLVLDRDTDIFSDTPNGKETTLPVYEKDSLIIMSNTPCILEDTGERCRGQQKRIPRLKDGSFPTHLTMIAAAEEDTTVSFSIADKRGEQHLRTLRMYGIDRPVGQYDQRTWKWKNDREQNYRYLNRCTGVEEGYVNRQRAALLSSAINTADRMIPCHPGYLYLYRIALCEEAETIRFPDDSSIRICSMTCSAPPIEMTPCRVLEDRYDL